MKLRWMLCLPLSAQCFVPVPMKFVKLPKSALQLALTDGSYASESSLPSLSHPVAKGRASGGAVVDRRALFRHTTALVSAATMANFGTHDVAKADDDDGSSTSVVVLKTNDSPGSSPQHPIVVLGGGGKTGKLCTELLANQGLYVRCVTRSGRNVLDDDEKRQTTVSYAAGDVTKYESIKSAVKGASGVIFLASASGKNQGSDPAHVDYLGVYHTAKACLEHQVPKLVLVSAGTTTRPDSMGFKATNAFVKFIYGDRIMDYKIAGEAAMRDLYAATKNNDTSNSNNPLSSYVVVRPGGLVDTPAVGPSKLHVSQGDVYSSEVSRQDVAQITVAALLSPATNFVTFEVNQVEGLAKVMSSMPDLPTELVNTGGSTYSDLLTGLVGDTEMRNRYSSLVNEFRGNGIQPLENLM